MPGSKASGPVRSRRRYNRSRVRLQILLLLLAALATKADVRTCECDVARPDVAKIPGCSLCAVAERQPAGDGVFLLKDIDPKKPSRWLALPRQHYDGPYPLNRMTRKERTDFWNAAIAKGQAMWGPDWAIAVNSDYRRLQCHIHAHIDRMRPGLEVAGGLYVDRPEEIPVHPDGMGLWFHPVGSRLHVHYDAEAPELDVFVMAPGAPSR